MHRTQKNKTTHVLFLMMNADDVYLKLIFIERFVASFRPKQERWNRLTISGFFLAVCLSVVSEEERDRFSMME